MEDLTAERLAELDALAEKAWLDCLTEDGYDTGWIGDGVFAKYWDDGIAAHLAACRPDTIRALVRMARKSPAARRLANIADAYVAGGPDPAVDTDALVLAVFEYRDAIGGRP